MRTHTRLFLGALAAAIVLASSVASASANRISISNRNFRATWNPISFTTGGEGEGIQVACNVTVEGSFHYSTIAKVRGSLLGFVTKAAVGHPCSGSGEVWAHNGIENAGLGVISNALPWHITYEGFEGTLPTISGIRRLLAILITLRTLLTGLCQYFGNSEGVVKLGRGGIATSIVPDVNVGIGKTGGGGFCPATAFFAANNENSTISVLGSTTKITVTLI